jgi:hypothetical protein
MPPWNLQRRCPLAGHLLLILLRGFTLGSAIKLQDGVDTNFPDPLGDGSFLCADGEFALVFMAAEFALDGHMRAFGEAAGEIGEFPEGIDATRSATPKIRRRSSRTSWWQARRSRCWLRWRPFFRRRCR